MKKISVITPAFNEEENLPAVHAELIPVLEGLGVEWEWIIIDDHSTDSTPDVIKGFARADSRIKGLRAAKNEGSHALCLFGFQKASGDCAVILSADGQDAPGNIARLVEEMKKTGSKVVWLTRAGGRDDPFFKRLMAGLYYFVMRRIMGVSSIPPDGGDMVLVRDGALDEIRRMRGKNINILAAVAEVGFSQSRVPGERRARVHGESRFTFSKNINLLFDTLTAHTVVPLRAITFLGFFTAFLGFLYGVNVVVAKFAGVPAEGWASLVLVVLILGGVQMVMLGIIGEYLWRTLENTRKQEVVVEERIGEWKGGTN